MGHRALIGYEHEDGTVESYYSHWGAMDLMLRAPLRDGALPGDTHKFTDSASETRSFKNKVDADEYTEPVTNLREFVRTVVDYDDHEAVYIVPFDNPERAVAYRPVSYRFDAAPKAFDRHEGTLLSPRWYEGEPLDSGLLGRAEGMKLVLDDFLKYDQMTHREAKRTLDAQMTSMVGRTTGQTWATVQMDTDTGVQIADLSPRAQAGAKPPTYRKREKPQ